MMPAGVEGGVGSGRFSLEREQCHVSDKADPAPIRRKQDQARRGERAPRGTTTDGSLDGASSSQKHAAAAPGDGADFPMRRFSSWPQRNDMGCGEESVGGIPARPGQARPVPHVGLGHAMPCHAMSFLFDFLFPPSCLRCVFFFLHKVFVNVYFTCINTSFFSVSLLSFSFLSLTVGLCLYYISMF